MAWTTPKTDWTTGELVTAADMNAVGENLAALRHPSTAVAAYTTTENISLNSESEFVDVDSTNLNLTITTAGGDVMVQFHGSVQLFGRRYAYFDIEVDGNRQGDTSGILNTYVHDARNHHIVSFVRLLQNLRAGSHTVKLQYKTISSVTLFTGAQFWVREI